jgi:hypothetical protein
MAMVTVSARDTFTFRNAEGPSGYQGFSVDWSLGLIRGEAEGFWRLDMTAQHVAAWAKCVRRIHAEGKPARAVADLRRAQTQSQEVASLVQREIADLYREGDRVAVVLPSGLLKTQIRRILSSEVSRYFDDIDDAERWALGC